MTAKQKAAQLRYKYSTLLDLKTTDGLVLQCALIAVNEILDAICFNMSDEDAYKKENDYWEEVKKELEKL